ncbi:MAG TPA: branched-chain amino acid ABC transporter permease [Kofleriaceae bacterium]|jgi:branched-chain amino acid transport system permease protein|nr:branched-chain amino acid ABC transporter permease [Kofleriaceae bacterium]
MTVPPLIPRGMARVFLAVCVVLAVLPALDLSLYTHNLLTRAYILIAAALAWNWMGGFVGQISFGHAAMFGVGGFVAARGMLDLHLPPQLCWLGGAVAAGVFALGAHPLLRLRGPYFSIATIGVGEASRVVFTYWEKFTGGATGLSLPIDADFQYQLYWWTLGVAAVVAAASVVIRRSSFGLRLLAIKADVEAAADVGISATLYQDLIFMLSGAVVGLCGGLSASYASFIEPSDTFGFERSIAFVLMAVIGGTGTALGPALGAAVFVLVDTSLLASYPELHLGLYGVLLINIMLFEPLGLLGLGQRVLRLARGPKPAPRRA